VEEIAKDEDKIPIELDLDIKTMLETDSIRDKGRFVATLQLFGCSAMWGTYPALMRTLYASPGAHLDPLSVTLIRFTVMAAVAVFVLLFSADTSQSISDVPAKATAEKQNSWESQLSNRTPSSLYLCALELGILGWLGTYLNSTGLQTVPTLKAGILLSFINVFTPLVSSIAGATPKDRSVPRNIWLASLFTLAVSAFALIPDGPDPNNPLLSFEAMQFGVAQQLSSGGGEWFLLGAALTFSSAKVRLGSQLRVHDPSRLSGMRLIAQWLIAVAAVVCINEVSPLLSEWWQHASGAGWAVADHAAAGAGTSGAEAEIISNAMTISSPSNSDFYSFLPHLSLRQSVLIFGSALASGTTATWLQAKGQSVVPATEAQLIYACTPIFSAFWAFIFLQEPVSVHEVAGGTGLIAAAIFTLKRPVAARQDI